MTPRAGDVLPGRGGRPGAPGVFPVRLAVEAGKVAEFCRATGLGGQASSEHAPPTFTAVSDHFGPTIAEMMTALGYDPGRVLHGEESIEYPSGALRVGQTLAGEARHTATEHREGRSGPLRLVRFEIELRSGDEVAARIHRTLVVIDDPSSGERPSGERAG